MNRAMYCRGLHSPFFCGVACPEGVGAATAGDQVVAAEIWQEIKFTEYLATGSV
ncbi:MAG: hypothetical protein AAGE59_26410 [Cyanobacteria bacterium P01_F01_bin.86]